MSNNPYALPPNPAGPTPPGYGMPMGNGIAPPGRRLASLGQRFLGALVDMLVGAVAFIPGYALIGISAVSQGGDPQQPPQISVLMLVGFGLLILSSLAVLVIQLFLLATRSQSIGKYVMKTQIVEFETGRRADWIKTILLRMLVHGVIASIPCVGFIYAIADIGFIFREDRRMVHDLLAGTSVCEL